MSVAAFLRLQPGWVDFSGVIGEEGVQPEVEARDFTRRDSVRNDYLLNHTEKQPQSPHSIPFNGEGFNSTTYRTMFHKFVGASTDLDFVPFQQFPTSLFEGERFALCRLQSSLRLDPLASPNLNVGVLRRFLDNGCYSAQGQTYSVLCARWLWGGEGWTPGESRRPSRCYRLLTGCTP